MVLSVRSIVGGAALALAVTMAASGVRAEPIENPVARFSGLDKITGRIISFDVYVGETVQFERQGYYCVDPDSTTDKPVFNKTTGLRDSWAKAQKTG